MTAKPFIAVSKRGSAWRFCGVALAFGVLGGCAGDQAPMSTNSRMFGLATGPLPPPAPFVEASRHPVADVYPAVGVTPPTRRDRVLSMEERKKLEADLKRYTDPNAKPSANNLLKRKKPVPAS